MALPHEPIKLTPEMLEAWDDKNVPSLFNLGPRLVADPDVTNYLNTPPCTPDGRTAK